MINHHLIKQFPLYKTHKNEIVKLIHIYSTDNGLTFVAEIMNGFNKGHWTQVKKKEIKLYKGNKLCII